MVRSMVWNVAPVTGVRGFFGTPPLGMFGGPGVPPSVLSYGTTTLAPNANAGMPVQGVADVTGMGDVFLQVSTALGGLAGI